MIYTVSFNPSLDYVQDLDCVNLGYVNRTSGEKILPGGKGINVSHVLANLGMESVGLGFIAGFTGDVIEKGAKELGFTPDFIRVREGMTRINVKVKSNEEKEKSQYTSARICASNQTPLRSIQNALTFKVKRTCVSSKTYLRLKANALAFQTKHKYILSETALRFTSNARPF